MKFLFLLFFFFTTSIATFAQTGNEPALKSKINAQLQNRKGLCFLENKGQMADMQGNAVNTLLFKTSTAGTDVYITTSGISYVFVKEPTKKNNKLHADDNSGFTYCRADMELIGASITKENIIKEIESTDYSNYFLSSCPQGISNVHSYQKVTIKNIYPGIDWVLYTRQSKSNSSQVLSNGEDLGKALKYDFIVHPGANPSLIKLKYKWTDEPELQNDGSIQINIPLGNITEGKPRSYELENKDKEIKTSYKIEGNEISFNVSEYNNISDLVIDPTLIWATFYGGEYKEEAFSLSVDSNNVWVTGLVQSINFPTFNPGGGAYFQDTLTNVSYNDAFILKFNKTDVLKWATYYGGTKQDKAYSISSDNKNVWVTGSTGSTDFPTYNPGGGVYYQPVLAGKTNAFILQFDTAGVRKWATYYGGTGNDSAWGINSDGNNVWVAGSTSSTNFPTQNLGGGAYYQPANGGGKEDAFVLQFNTSGIRQWATYYGGSGDDKAYSINSDGKNVWLTGYTSSTDFPTQNPGGGAYFQNSLAGKKNAFILQLSASAVRNWATYYGGNNMDYGASIQSDGVNVWVTGSTTSTNFPTHNPGGGAYFQAQNAGTSLLNDIFILKFSIKGICNWSTYFGGYGNDYGNSIYSDGTHIWLTGTTWTQDDSLNYPWIYTHDPGKGAFFQGPDYNDVQNGGWNTFIIEFNTSGVCRWATYYGTLGGSEGNAIQSDGLKVWITGGMDHNDGIFPVKNPGGGAYYQDTIDSHFMHQSTNTVFMGEFTACLYPDISIFPEPDTICIGDSVMLTASGGNTYTWVPSTGLSSTTGDSTIASPPGTTTYTINYVAGKCKGHDTAIVNVVQKPIPKTPPAQAICMGSSITLNASGGTKYTWSPPATLNNDSIANPVASPTVTTTYTVMVSNRACSVKDSETVVINSKPIIVACCNTTIDEGQSVALSLNPLTNGDTYDWTPNSGLTCNTCADPTASPDVTTNYYITITDSAGCTTTDTVTIDINCGGLFVPQAFSPNGDGQNDVLYVRDNCIKYLNFQVFDRWGNRVFETNDKSNGWDGRYKGAAMNTGSYVYYLDATLYDGTNIKKKGNVELIR